MALIWIAEDNNKIQAHIHALLREEGYLTKGFSSAEELEAQLASIETLPELLLLDLRLPGKSGMDLVTQQIGKRLPPTIVVSGEATVTQALELLRLGIHDFVEKPFSDERLLCSVRNCLEKLELARKVAALERQLQQQSGQAILGEAPSTQRLMEQLRKVAPTQGRVLIVGESGTGKELVAACIHRLSQRHDKPFVRINCAAFPEHLIEAELFGYVRGAFTDARQNKSGLFEEADGGTLFLDEIGDMEFTLQARLLRVLEDGRIRRIGENRERPVNVRVIAATNRDLQRMVTEGRFREDLYYRLASLPIQVPALRHRQEDISLLFRYYINYFCRQNQIRVKEIDTPAITALQSYHWPGNIRELKNLAERLVIFAADPIGLDDLPSHFHGQVAPESSELVRLSEAPTMALRDFKALCEKEYIENLLRRSNWNYCKVAEWLEINRSYLHQKITALGIQRKISHEA